MFGDGDLFVDWYIYLVSKKFIFLYQKQYETGEQMKVVGIENGSERHFCYLLRIRMDQQSVERCYSV